MTANFIITGTLHDVNGRSIDAIRQSFGVPKTPNYEVHITACTATTLTPFIDNRYIAMKCVVTVVAVKNCCTM